MPQGWTSVATVAGVMAVSAPFAPMVYCEIVSLPKLATYANRPVGSTAMVRGVVPAATGAPSEESAPSSTPIVYCETVPSAEFAT